MAVSERGCCVPECGKTRTDDTVLHSFPNPDKDFDRYIAWTQAVGLDTSLDPHYVYRNRRVCHAHFEIKYLTWTRRLSAGAVPTLFLPGSEMAEAPLIDIINRPENVSLDVALPSPSRGSEMGEDPLIDITNRPENVSLDAALSSPSRGSEMDEDPLIDITNRPENVSLDAALPSPSKACQMTSNFENIKLSSFTWLNEPSQWSLADEVLQVTTDNRTDFWQGTWYNFRVNTGHVYGVELKDDFTLEMYIEADFTTLYDQAGLMIYVDEKHWLKAGIEYNDGQPMIGSVLTNEDSDWATGVYPGDPKKFWLRLTKVGAVVCVKYSTDGVTWTLLRLSPFAVAEKYFVGPMCCTPQRDGLTVKFSGLTVRQPDDDILHSN